MSGCFELYHRFLECSLASPLSENGGAPAHRLQVPCQPAILYAGPKRRHCLCGTHISRPWSPAGHSAVSSKPSQPANQGVISLRLTIVWNDVPPSTSFGPGGCGQFGLVLRPWRCRQSRLCALHGMSLSEKRPSLPLTLALCSCHLSVSISPAFFPSSEPLIS